MMFIPRFLGHASLETRQKVGSGGQYESRVSIG